MHDVHRQVRAIRSPSSLGRIAVAAPFHDEGYGYDVFGLHPPTLERVLALGAPIYDRYFRVASEGIEHVPTRGAAILVANHGGMLPVDAAMLCFDVLRRLTPPRIPRAIIDRFVPHLPVIGTLFARCGAVSGTRRNATHLLERGELLAIYPEGVSGPAKRFRDRYRIQSWSPGFAELAIRHQAAIVPVAILGAEESWPLLGKLDLHWFGSPYLPVGAWPIPLPAHYRIRYGEPVDLHRDYAPEAADSPALVAEAAARVRTILERQIEDFRMIRRGVFR
jgi:1-acyl-sn-glycerol-3-phosphate acyltransferase